MEVKTTSFIFVKTFKIMYYYFSELQLAEQTRNGNHTHCYVNGEEYTQCSETPGCLWEDAVLVLVDLDFYATVTYA